MKHNKQNNNKENEAHHFIFDLFTEDQLSTKVKTCGYVIVKYNDCHFRVNYQIIIKPRTHL